MKEARLICECGFRKLIRAPSIEELKEAICEAGWIWLQVPQPNANGICADCRGES